MTIELENGPPPEWMIALENKKQNHKLAHEIGAGAPCLKCNDECTGLDLHFWRKICRNCKCKKELHDVKEENNFEQFEILFGENLRGNERIKKISIDLKSKLNDIFANRESAGKENLITKSENDLSFDWIPSDVPANLATEYLQQLPLDKLPITGSAGAMLRRRQLQKQIPLHDFKVNNCHDLTDEETLAFTEYIDNLKTNAVGKGLITKIIPSTIIPEKMSKLPAFSNNLNSTPKPFKSFSESQLEKNDDDLPAPPSELLLPATELKTPSAFVPYRKLNANIAPKTIVESDRVPCTTEPYHHDTLAPTSSAVTQLSAQYSEKLAVDKKLDAVNNNAATSPVENLKPSDIIRKFNARQPLSGNAAAAREATAKHEVVRAPHAYCERSRPYAFTSPPLRDTSSDAIAKNVDVRFMKLGHPEQFVALSSYVPNKPQLSNALTTTSPERDRNQNPRVHFGATTTYHTDDEIVEPSGHQTMTPFHNSATENANTYALESNVDIYCHQCKRPVSPGQVVVAAERAGVEVIWHPQCFICVICRELLVDLVYFFHRGEVYCGRHYAEVLKIPRCFACDELIFLKEYTVAEGQTFHIRHFCCFECDIPLAEKSYVSKDNNPVCLPCYELKYSKKCNCCGATIKAGDSRVGWKELSWHATSSCFKCVQCLKSLLGGKFVVRSDKPLCSKECIVKFELSVS